MAVDHNNPQSRDEEILIATIDGTEYNKNPQSRMEELLLELKETIEEGGGGGGTTNYNNLSNQPQVNGETLIGDKSGADLGLVDAEEGKGLSTNDYDDTEKAAVAAATSAITAMKDGSELDSFGDVEVALLDKADTSDLGTAAAKDSTNAVTSGSTDLVESGAVKDAIDAAVAAAYHHAGTKTVAQLTHDLLIAANEGNVYNITDSGTTTSDFIEGIGKTIDEGSNVGICKVGDVYMFDLLSGFVDTTNFIQKSQTAGLLNNDGTVNTTIESTVAGHTTAIASVESNLTTLDNEVNGDATYPYADVITIEDAVPSNLADCSVKIDPVQDLHGYDKPWVGGAGKNKVNPAGWSNLTNNGITYTVDKDNGEITISNTATANSSVDYDLSNLLPNTQYILTGAPSTSSESSTYNLQVQPLGVKDIGNGVTFTTGNDVSNYKLRITVYNGVSGNNAVFKPMVRLATVSDDTWEPYENICPISGHTEASVEVTDGDETTKTYTISLGDTIYGGTVDFDSGVMTVTHAYAHAKDFAWGFNGSTETSLYEKTTSIPKAYGLYNIISDKLSSNGDYTITGRGDSNLVSIKVPLSAAANDTEFAAWLTTNNPEVCYELATPTTIQLTPQQIQLLKGQNTLTASTGQISVTVNGVSGAIGQVQEQVNDHEERIEDLESGLDTVKSGLTDLSGVTIFTTDADLISAFRDKHNYHKMIMLIDSTKTMALLNTTDREKMFVMLTERSEMWSNHPNYMAFINNDVFVGVLNIGSTSVSVTTCVKLAEAT